MDDHSWILLPKSDERWQAGYKDFIEDAFGDAIEDVLQPVPA
jgi:hypothetical protein